MDPCDGRIIISHDVLFYEDYYDLSLLIADKDESEFRQVVQKVNGIDASPTIFGQCCICIPNTMESHLNCIDDRSLHVSITEPEQTVT